MMRVSLQLWQTEYALYHRPTWKLHIDRMVWDWYARALVSSHAFESRQIVSARPSGATARSSWPRSADTWPDSVSAMASL